MSGCHVTAKVAIAALRNLKELRRLELPFCSEFGDEGAKGLPSVCPYLELVDLYSCRTLTNEGLLSMASSLPYLKCLNAKRCHKLASFQVCDVLEHKALLHLQLPNFAGLNSCAVMLKLENAGFTMKGPEDYSVAAVLSELQIQPMKALRHTPRLACTCDARCASSRVQVYDKCQGWMPGFDDAPSHDHPITRVAEGYGGRMGGA
eukprot:CAMPEP_0167771832 /NCGR_PEP_ID=MMETSP0111_2-20121227/502_1 /TAXON_ID=91324 /ORGANISM="Lotharella globosa, Strain CCCM811" /LENGTH=204 /DNA_ID=CAMNT_0007661239 /DNA_START=836 /DNA_END=1451 /DNA_ORIENTATION=-